MSDNSELKIKDSKNLDDGLQGKLSESALDLLKAAPKKCYTSGNDTDPLTVKKAGFPKVDFEGRKEEKDKSDYKDGKLNEKINTDAKVPSASTAFLAAHPELGLSKVEQAKLTDEYNDLTDKCLNHKEQLRELKKKEEKLIKDLAADGVTTPEQFQKLPRKKQEAYLKRRDELFEPDGQTSKIDKLEQELIKDSKKQQLIEAKLDFQSDLKALEKLPKEKQTEIFKSLHTILDKNDKGQTTNLTDAERLQIVQDVVHQIAHPESIKQGNKNTCALASVEGILARDCPDVYAKAVAELATQGELRTFAGRQVDAGKGIKITNDDIHKDDGNPERSLASKILQTGLANVAAAEDGQRYVNHKPGEAPPLTPDPSDPLHRTTPVDDTGERLVDQNNKDENGQPKVEDWPGLSGDEQADLLNKLTGQNYILEKIPIDSPIALAETIETLAKEHGYPLKISLGYPSPNDDEKHAILITGIDHSKSPPEIIYNDPARSRKEALRMPIDRFYRTALQGEYDLTDDEGVKHTQLRGPMLGDPDYDPYIAIIHR